jgi:hypothetical protein
MNTEIENDQITDSEMQSVEDILFDFISALDEAIATYKVLDKIKEEDSKANQLLFSHIVNSFDSFVSRLLEFVIFSDNENLKKYFEKETNLNEKTALKDVISMHENGIYEWMKKKAKGILENDLRRKRHSQKLELLLENIGIKFNEIFVHLTGGGKYAIGFLKEKPTPKAKLTINHKTTSEKLIGYADILYEKRNAITHNRNEYSQQVIDRLNQNWSLKIDRKLVVIKRSTIKALVRFYPSICSKIILSAKIKGAIESKFEEFESYLEELKKGENICIKNPEDARFIGGGIESRRKKLIANSIVDIKMNDYASENKISLSTAHRDFEHFITEGLLKKAKNGIYKVLKK